MMQLHAVCDVLIGLMCLLASGAAAFWMIQRFRRMPFRMLCVLFTSLLFSFGAAHLAAALAVGGRDPVIATGLNRLIALTAFSVACMVTLLAPYVLSVSRVFRVAEARRSQIEAQSRVLAAAAREQQHAELLLDVRRRTIEMANHSLELQNHQLTELYQSSERLVDDVAHDLRTPLSVIKGYSEIMHEGIAGPLTADQTRYSELIIDRTRDLAQMVDDLSDMIKLRAGTLHVDRRACDLRDIIATLHPVIDTRLAVNNIRWFEDVPPGLPEGFADPEKAARTLLNIVINAIKAAPECTCITLSAEKFADGNLCIRVSDQGPGISPDNLAALNQRFGHAGRSVSRNKGLGIGLDAASQVALLNLGSLSAVSGLREGSTFSFTVPSNDPEIILAAWFHLMEARGANAGSLCILRVTPEEDGPAVAQLRGFLSSIAEPTELILPAGDGKSFVLLGCSADPEAWLQRLKDSGHGALPPGSRPKAGRFDVEMIAARRFPMALSQATSVLHECLEGAATLV